MRIALLFLLAGQVCAGETAYEGEVVPRDFVAVYAPMNTIRLPHWGSSSNGISLADVKGEDASVEPGEVVAEFRFGHERAREHLEQRRAQLKSERDEELLARAKTIRDLENELARLTLEREKVRLEMMLALSLARVKQKLLEYDYQLKALEADAAALRLKAAQVELARTAEVHEARIKSWEGHFQVYAETRARFTVKAPVAGRVFYPTIESSSRKVRKGDDMNSGTHFVSIVQSDRAQVKFFVPEADWERVRVGDQVTVAPDGPAPYRARIAAVDYFAQYVGDARRNFRLPAAWEKCFVVWADVEGSFSKITRKEVTVKLDR